jgi:hypothetical protein
MKALALQILFSIAVFAGGYACGLHYAETRALKAEVKAVNETAQQSAVDVGKAQATSVKTEVKIAAQSANIDKNKPVIRDRVEHLLDQHHSDPFPTEINDETHPSGSAACRGFYLDAGTVRVLNASRAGAAFDPAGSLDEAGDAAPALCFTDFIDADQELTKLYLDLAERHNVLVDSVEGFQADQRRRLGVVEDPAS